MNNRTLTSFKKLLQGTLRNRDLKLIYEKFKDYTMVPEEWYISNLELAMTVKHIDGCVVECGVWKGGMIAGIASILSNNREYWLFDSFEGLPSAKEVDGESALAWQRDTSSPNYHDNCSADEKTATLALKMADVKKYNLVKGWFENTLPNYKQGEPIALLRLDADWYESTMNCLENLYDRVETGGIIIIDDYFTWDGCSKAVHKFLSDRSASERIDNHNGVCYIIKK